jgi:hypothetical protein
MSAFTPFGLASIAFGLGAIALLKVYEARSIYPTVLSTIPVALLIFGAVASFVGGLVAVSLRG